MCRDAIKKKGIGIVRLALNSMYTSWDERSSLGSSDAVLTNGHHRNRPASISTDVSTTCSQLYVRFASNIAGARKMEVTALYKTIATNGCVNTFITRKTQETRNMEAVIQFGIAINSIHGITSVINMD